MESVYGEMPPPIAAARRIGWVLYADHQDLRAGRTAEVARRVLRRARRGRVLLVAVILAYGCIEVPATLAHGWPDFGAFYVLAIAGVGFAKLQRMIRGLEELA